MSKIKTFFKSFDDNKALARDIFILAFVVFAIAFLFNFPNGALAVTLIVVFAVYFGFKKLKKQKSVDNTAEQVEPPYKTEPNPKED